MRDSAGRRREVGVIRAGFHLEGVSGEQVGPAGPRFHLQGVRRVLGRKVGQIGPSFALQGMTQFRDSLGQTGLSAH
jgi:hypothetical protein